jgi:hypothetical protein
LVHLGEGTAKDCPAINLDNDELRSKIVRDVYEQYALLKPREYTSQVIGLLGNNPSPEQLEEAVRVLYKAIGEAAFGIGFLGKNGRYIFPEDQISIEVIKLEASIQSLEALKGLYTFEFMKSRRATLTEEIAAGITRGVVEGLKHPH